MPTDVATIELARQLVTKLEVNPASLHSDIAIPTVADYLPIVYAAASPHMLRSYGTYWQRAAKYFARQRLDQIKPSNIGALHRQVIATARNEPTAAAADTPVRT